MAGNRRWTDFEEGIIQKEYGKTDLEKLANKLDRSVNAVQWKASKMGIPLKRELSKHEYQSIQYSIRDIRTEISEIKEILRRLEERL